MTPEDWLTDRPSPVPVDKLIIQGGVRYREVRISGAKNLSPAILCATS